MTITEQDTPAHPGRGNGIVGAKWTDERAERVRELWGKEGWSASQIAHDLGGISRNGVIGKAHRMGLPKYKKSPQTEASVRTINRKRKLRATPSAPRQKTVVTSRMRLIPNGAGYVLHETMEIEQVSETIDAVPAGQGKSLLELDNQHCRFPIGDGEDLFFCGHPSANLNENRPYCKHHSKLAYLPRKILNQPYYVTHGKQSVHS